MKRLTLIGLGCSQQVSLACLSPQGGAVIGHSCAGGGYLSTTDMLKGSELLERIPLLWVAGLLCSVLPRQ